MNRRSFLSLLGLTPLVVLARPSILPVAITHSKRAEFKHAHLTNCCYTETFHDAATNEAYTFLHLWDPCWSWTPGSPARISILRPSGWVPISDLRWNRSRGGVQDLLWTE